jgi:hypothetical protein
MGRGKNRDSAPIYLPGFQDGAGNGEGVGLADGAGLIADGFEIAELMEVPDKVFAPVAGADEGDTRR